MMKSKKLRNLNLKTRDNQDQMPRAVPRMNLVLKRLKPRTALLANLERVRPQRTLRKWEVDAEADAELPLVSLIYYI
jgi:hypothetical protein